MSAKNAVIRQQRRWAESAGVRVDARGYVLQLADNFQVPPSATTLTAFDRPRGSELRPGRTRPPRFWALHSSAALVVNVFDHWRRAERSPLIAALRLSGDSAAPAFEEAFPTGIAGDPPYVDVVLKLSSGRVVAIESKFTEALTARPRNRAVFKAKYFPPGRSIWTQAGLSSCQELADDIQRGRERFKFLHAAQLLKQALALRLACGSDFLLYYLYYDWPGLESAAHRADIERFRERVGSEVPFTALTYQDLYRALSAGGSVDTGYLMYLRSRYFASLRD
jgi:hypothetical protein